MKGPFTNIQNGKLGIQRVVAYGVSEVAEFVIVFRGVGGRLGVILTFGFFGKSEAQWNFLFPFLKIVHRKGLLGRIK